MEAAWLRFLERQFKALSIAEEAETIASPWLNYVAGYAFVGDRSWGRFSFLPGFGASARTL
jgi:hypothetical protein